MITGFPRGNGVGPTTGGVSDNVTIQGDGTSDDPFAVKDLGITTGKLADGSVALAKIAADVIAAFDAAGAASAALAFAEAYADTLNATAVHLTGDQTVAGIKSFTSPAISGASLSGTLSGNHTVSGVATFTAVPVVSITNATTNDITDVVDFRHLTSGTAANNIAAGILLSTQDTAGNVQSTARIAAVLTNATSGSETSAIDFYTWSSGALSNKLRIGSDGGVVAGTTTALGGIGFGVPNGASYYGRNSTNTGWNILIIMNGTRPEFGNSGQACMFRGTPAQILSGSTIDFFPANQTGPSLSTTAMAFGLNDASASATDYLLRGANITGSNANGKTLTLRACLGTGTGTLGRLVFEGGIVGSTGVAAHATTRLFEPIHSAVDNEVFGKIGWRKSGVDVLDARIEVGAADSGKAGYRLLCIPN